MTCEPEAFRLPLLINECVYNYSAFFAFIFGYLSILCWVFAQIPQLLKNFRLKQYINIKFILIWLLGDVCNLLGSRLTSQRPFQVYLATYFVVIDSMLLSQCIYYKNGPLNLRIEETLSPSLLSPLLSASPVKGFSPENNLLIGQSLSWVCCILYLVSRLPQIFSNHRKRSTKALSMLMFGCALGGNVFYSLSLFLDWKENAYPFLIGSMGTIGLDLCIFLQYFLFKQDESHVD